MHLLATTTHAQREGRQPEPNTFKKLVDLNEVVAQALKEVCPAGMVIRRDALPVIEGSSLQLQHAFRNLVQTIIAVPPALGPHYLYFKFLEPDALTAGLQSKPGAGTIAVFSNNRGTALVDASLKDAGAMVQALFEVNGIQIKVPEPSGDDCIFLLTLAGKPDV